MERILTYISNEINKRYNGQTIMVLALMFIIIGSFILCMERMKQVNACNYEPNVIKWISPNNCKINGTIKKVLDDNGMKKTTSNCDWQIYIPCTYNNLHKQIANVPKNLGSGRKIFLIDNADELCSKNNIWKNMVKHYGRDKAASIMPVTYILNNKDDMQRFQTEFNKTKLYILKKNIQRQKGLMITNDYNKILQASKDNFVIVQELLQDPYLIDGRKINLRVYILVVCNQGKIEAYVFNDGFIYYTAEKYRKNAPDDGPNITTGYIDRKIYEVNPLTHNDFRIYLDTKQRELVPKETELLSKKIKISQHVFDGIYELVRKVILGMNGVICQNTSQIYNTTTFQLLGADIAINDNLDAQLIEINKGPDLGAKDERDRKLKELVINDMLAVINKGGSTISSLSSVGGGVGGGIAGGIAGGVGGGVGGVGGGVSAGGVGNIGGYIKVV